MHLLSSSLVKCFVCKMFNEILTILGVFLWLLLFVYLYFYCVKPQRYWEENGVVHETPVLFVGNLFRYLSYEFSLTELIQFIYNKYPNERYVGFYKFNLPVLLIRDPELINQLIANEFDGFPECLSSIKQTADPMWPKNFFDIAGGKQWQDLRQILTPAFHTSQLKNMFGFVTECSIRFINHYAMEMELEEVDMADAFARVTNDIIASTFFGVKGNSLRNQNDEFYWMGRVAADLHYVKSMKFYEASIDPLLAKLFGVRFFKEEPTAYFKKLIEDTIANREKNRIIRTDIIHLLMEAKKEKKFEQEDIIIAQVVQFILAGYYIVSTTMCYMAYELALNPQVQETLHDEVEEALRNKMGRINYEDLRKMEYMDKVVKEVLRKWPPFPIIDRRPAVPFVIESSNPGEKHLVLYDNIAVQVSVYAIHRDPRYYPNPQKFSPERFNEDNISKRPPNTYLPFGTGPRMCLGIDFALLEIKTVIFYMLTKFEIYPIERTSCPIVFQKHCVIPFPENGFWLGLRLRDSPNSSEINKLYESL